MTGSAGAERCGGRALPPAAAVPALPPARPLSAPDSMLPEREQRQSHCSRGFFSKVMEILRSGLAQRGADSHRLGCPSPAPRRCPVLGSTLRLGGSCTPHSAPQVSPAAVTSTRQGQARGTELVPNIPCSNYSPSSISFPRAAVRDGSTSWCSTTELRYSSCGSCLAWTVFLHVFVLKKMCSLIEISLLT